AKGALRKMSAAGDRMPSRCRGQGASVFLQRQVVLAQRRGQREPHALRGQLNVEAGASIRLQGANSAHLYTILSGWTFRYKTLPDGRRQILNYALPSDLIGLQGSVNDEMQHSVEALTDVMLCVFPREKLWDLYSNYP